VLVSGIGVDCEALGLVLARSVKLYRSRRSNHVGLTITPSKHPIQHPNSPQTSPPLPQPPLLLLPGLLPAQGRRRGPPRCRHLPALQVRLMHCGWGWGWGWVWVWGGGGSIILSLSYSALIKSTPPQIHPPNPAHPNQPLQTNFAPNPTPKPTHPNPHPACREELWENCKALWTIWVPAQMVNFTLVPRHLRIPYGALALAFRSHSGRVLVGGWAADALRGGCIACRAHRRCLFAYGCSASRLPPPHHHSSHLDPLIPHQRSPPPAPPALHRAVAGVSFLWTVILSVMRGALKDASAPTTQQLADAVESVAAAAAAAAAPATAALAEAPAGMGQQCGCGAGGRADGGNGNGGSVLAARGGAVVGVGGAAAGLGLKALVGSPTE